MVPVVEPEQTEDVVVVRPQEKPEKDEGNKHENNSK